MKVKFTPCNCFILFVAIIFLPSCSNKKESALFTQLSAAESGIHFSNDIHDSDSSNSFINEFGYMGGGVGIGDFNNDGLKDIFFSGNQVSCRVYINKGSNKFDDISEKAGINTHVWATGVSIVDINNDGYDDIYVCVFGVNLLSRAKNMLFINQHDLTFKEEAAAYGLADTSFSTQALFFDYDKDGDLDMYLLNYLLGKNTNSIVPRDTSGTSLANDRMYRNDGIKPGTAHPVFADVTLQANIKEDGYGLGASISDFNNDGWPDVYVANDFLSNDELWLNNRNGTFTNCIDKSIQHQSYSSMGTDAADINNDALPDIVTLDMLPEYNDRKKNSFFFMNYERYDAERMRGYEPEFMRNMLQLNNGSITAGNTSIPFFSEIGQLAGIQATDWSWSILLADFDNDGWKDMHITNGIGRDFINGDFLEFSSRIFGGNQSRPEQEKAIRKRLAELDHVNLHNYLYINNRNYTFADASASGGIDAPSMSNGAAYADLDNDGDLDLVINNIDKEAFTFINNTNQRNQPLHTHFLSVRLQGTSANKNGFGTRVFIYANGSVQVQEQYPVRGYFSSVDQQLLFGLGKYDRVDSLVATWPDNKRQVIKNVAADTMITVSWQNGAYDQPVVPEKRQLLFSDITSRSGIEYRHHDANYNDFAFQRLLMHKYSQLGPFITTGDINNDGATDFFIGGAYGFSGQLFTQQKVSFKATPLTDSVPLEEDMDCLLFDADSDGDPDLVVTYGDVIYTENSIHYKPRLYLNDGKGKFSLQANAFPATVTTVAGCVTAGDYDKDGDMDLFIGGRVSRQYPKSPRSFVLQNNKGIFTDVTAVVCPALTTAGMITAGVWTDFDNDQQADLVIAGEWTPIRFFKNDHQRLVEVPGSSSGLLNTNGMWRSLIAADVDNDGDMDMVAGNLGLNCDYQVSPAQPMQLFATDLDRNGSIDPVLFYHIKDRDGKKSSFPAISRSQFSEQVPAIKKKFLLYKDYSRATFDDIFGGKEKDSLLQLYCDETRSCFFENKGKGRFVKHPLPMEAQFAPVNAIICSDLDKDGYKDLLLAGNEYQSEVISGRYDASYGCFLRGSAKKIFEPVPPVKSGFILKGDIKDMEMITSATGEKMILAAVNNDSLRVFSINK